MGAEGKRQIFQRELQIIYVTILLSWREPTPLLVVPSLPSEAYRMVTGRKSHHPEEL